MNTPDPKSSPAQATPIDLDQVAKLVAALDQDLIKVQQGSQDLQALRAEVAALQIVLNADSKNQHEVTDGLDRIRSSLENAKEIIVDDAIKVAQYVAEIGRLIGM